MSQAHDGRTPAARVDAVGVWLARVGGAAAPGDIAAAVGLNHRTQAAALGTMREAGLLEGPRTQVRLTAAGWAKFSGVGSESAGEVLDRATAGWPYTHRAFLELLVSTIIARHHLGATRRTGHLGFIAIGETGTGKSAMGGLVCHLFGFPEAQHKLHVPAQTAGALLGRREQDGDGWRWVPAPTTRLPFVVLDEFDKAEEPVQRRAWLYLHDALDQQLEGQVHELLPTALLLANPPRTGSRYAQLRQEYRRRSVVLDTGAMAGRSGELEDLLGRYYATTTPADRLSLEQLVPPADHLGRDALEVLKMARDQALTQAGREEFPTVRVLELTALGRLALMGPDADEQVAAWATAVAYLQATESVPGQVIDQWGPDLAQVRSVLGQGGGAIAAALERGRAERAAALGEAARGRQREARAELGALEDARYLVAELRHLAAALDGRKVTPADATRAKAMRDVLLMLAGRAGKITTRASLDQLREEALDLMDRARRLVAAQEAARAAAEQARREAAEQVRQERAQAKIGRQAHLEARRAARDQARQQLAAARRYAAPLEALYRRKTTRPDERPLDTLRARTLPDGRPLLTYQPNPEPEPRGFFDRLLSGRAGGVWRVTGSGVVFPGDARGCPDLASWGAATRAVLTPALVAAHGAEDALCARLGAAARTGRPEVARPGPAPAPAALPSAAERYGLTR